MYIPQVYFQSTVDFNPGPISAAITSQGSSDIFVHKMDEDGNFIWARAVGGNQWDEAQAIVSDNEGNVYVSGYFRGTVDFDPSISTHFKTAVGEDDIFVMKLSSNGSFEWVQTVGGSDSEEGHSLTLDQDGNIFVTGYYEGNIDFPVGSGIESLNSQTPWGSDYFLLKLNNNGNLLWAKSFGGEGNDIATSIHCDNNGNIFMTGQFMGTADFSTSDIPFELTSNGDTDIFLQKLDNNGNLQWVRTIGSTGNDFGQSITSDPAGNLYMSGMYTGTVDFAPGPNVHELTAQGLHDIFLQKYDNNGNMLWSRSMGGDTNG